MDDLKDIYDKITQAEAILGNLEKKRTDKNVDKSADRLPSEEYRARIPNARQAISLIKGKLDKELVSRTHDLEKCRQKLDTLQTRLKVGEISQESHDNHSRDLLEKIKTLENKVSAIQGLIKARFAEDIAPILESEQASPDLGTDGETQITPPRAISEASKEPVSSGLQQEPVGIDSGGSAPVNQNRKNGEKEAGDTVSSDKRTEGDTKVNKPSLHLHPKNTSSSNLPPEADKGKKNWLFFILIALFVGILAWGAIFLFIPKEGHRIGDAAPNFVMQVGSENATSLSAFKGKTVLLVFWDRDFWDGQFFYINGVQRRLYAPIKLNELYDKYSRNELAIIAIATGTSNNEVDRLVSDHDIKFPVIVDSFGKLRDSYQINYEPTYVFVDKERVIRARVEGPITSTSDLEQYIYNTSKNLPSKVSKPPISEVIIQEISEKAAMVNWSTDQPATSQVDIDGKNIQTVITPAPQTLHSIILRDLNPGTAYHLRILYNINNINVSEHSFSALEDTVVSKKYVVTTSNKDSSNPEISNISTGFITDSSVTVTWKTDEPASSEVDYSLDRTYKDSTQMTGALSIWHTVKVDGLKPDSIYNLKLRSRDASGKETSQEIEPIQTLSLSAIAPVVGKHAPDFTLYSINGTSFTLSQFQGYKVLLNFWLLGCAACESEMPILQTAFDKYSRDQLIILAVNVRGDPDDVKFYLDRDKLTFPVLMDTDGNVDDSYSVPFFPTTFLIDSKGVINEIVGERFQTISQIDDAVSKLD